MSNDQPTAMTMAVDSRPWRLVVPALAWSSAYRALLHDRSLWATGRMTWNGTPTVRELLVSRLDTQPTPPLGSLQPPLADSIVIRAIPARRSVPGERMPNPAASTRAARLAPETRSSNVASHSTLAVPGPPTETASLETLTVETVAQVAAQLQPQPTQLLVVIVLDMTNPGRWDGAVVHNGQCEPLAEWRISGPGALRLTREWDREFEEEDENEELVRWASRTRGALGDELYRRVRQATVTIVGCGRLGTALGFQLAGIGVSRIRLLDADRLQWENLACMPGLAAADIGQPKVEAVARRLREFRPDLGVRILAKSITDPEAFEFFRERSDLLITAVDHDVPRLATSIIARRTLTLHMDVATSVQRQADGSRSMSGDVRLFLPGPGGGCVACVGGLEDEEETLYELNAPPGSLMRRMPLAWDQQRAGSLVSLNALTSGAAVQVWLDNLAGRVQGSFWQRLAWTPDRGLDGQAGVVRGAENCRFCGADPSESSSERGLQ